MSVIKVDGSKNSYLFSIIEASSYDDLPDWGGIYLAVNAAGMGGVRMEDCIALGSCTSFQKFKEKIKAFTEGKCTHLYLMPEFEVERRKITLEDIMSSPEYQAAVLKTLEIPTLILEHPHIS